MVSDTAFYITLGIAIFLFIALVSFVMMLRSKMPPMMMRVLSTLHATLFGYEQALVEMIGSRGYRTHVFPEIVKVINTLKLESGQISEVFNAKTPMDAMEKWLQAIMDAKVVFNASITNMNGSGYKINIPNCSMCHPIHSIIGEKKGICPMALIVAAAASIVEPDKEPAISYSEFTPTGTTTTLTFKEKSD